jgi:signal transduction histidine kinase
MVALKFFLALLMLGDGFGYPEQQSGPDNVHQEQNGPHYLYDRDTERFIPVERTPAAADSLLAMADEMMNRDARISFHSARAALLLSEEIGYREGISRALNLVANKYLDFGDYELALSHYHRAIELEEYLGNLERVATLLNNMALVHLEQGNYDSSADYLHKSIELKQELGLEADIYLAMNNLGVSYRRQGEYQKAIGYFRESQRMSLETAQDSLVHMVATLNIGNTLRNKGELDEPLGYLLKASNYFEEKELNLHLIVSNLFMGLLYRDRQEYDTALQYALKSLEMAERAGQRERIKDAHELAATIYEKKGDFRHALGHYQLFQQISDTLYNLQRAGLINEMQVRFDVEQKNREIDLLNKEFALKESKIVQQEQVRKSLMTGLFLLLVIAALLVWTNHQRKRNNRVLKEKQAEIEEQNKKLAQMNREKDEFLGIVAHDLRNPLSVIDTAVELINHDENPSASELEEYTNLITISSHRMLNLVNNLLDIQCMNEGKKKASSEEVDINRAVEQSVAHFRKSAEAKNITLNLDLAEQCPGIMGDTNNLVRIFDNLISNAIKYSPFDSHVAITGTEEKGMVRISVADNGAGIAPEEMDKLFGKYSRLSNKPTGNEKSTGLGLFIVKKLAASMSGDVGCESEPGKGSTFYVEFPVIRNGGSEPVRYGAMAGAATGAASF